MTNIPSTKLIVGCAIALDLVYLWRPWQRVCSPSVCSGQGSRRWTILQRIRTPKSAKVCHPVYCTDAALTWLPTSFPESRAQRGLDRRAEFHETANQLGPFMLQIAAALPTLLVFGVAALPFQFQHVGPADVLSTDASLPHPVYHDRQCLGSCWPRAVLPADHRPGMTLEQPRKTGQRRKMRRLPRPPR